MLQKLRNRKGFTLVELMIVVAIIGILAAIAIPNFLKFQAKSKMSEAKTNLGAIYTGELAYFGEQNRYSDFNAINWSPAGTPRYHFALGTWSAAVNNDNVNRGAIVNDPEPTTWTANVNNALDAAGALVAPVAPAFADNTFSAGAGGIISTVAYSDGWSINELRQLVWVVDGT